MQSKKMSLLESLTNILVGVLIAFGSQIVIFGYYGIPVSLELNVKMVFWFTMVSLVRSYILRRIFNRLGNKH